MGFDGPVAFRAHGLTGVVVRSAQALAGCSSVFPSKERLLEFLFAKVYPRS